MRRQGIGRVRLPTAAMPLQKVYVIGMYRPYTALICPSEFLNRQKLSTLPTLGGFSRGFCSTVYVSSSNTNSASNSRTKQSIVNAMSSSGIQRRRNHRIHFRFRVAGCVAAASFTRSSLLDRLSIVRLGLEHAGEFRGRLGESPQLHRARPAIKCSLPGSSSLMSSVIEILACAKAAAVIAKLQIRLRKLRRAR